MKPRIKFGLIVGGVSFLLTICISTLIGICGPGVSLFAGAVAGFLAARGEKVPTQPEGAKVGAVAGAVSGAIAMLGQIFGGIFTLTFLPDLMSSLGDSSYLGSSQDAGYWLGGGAMMLCFGLVGVVFSTLTGAAGGYFGVSKEENVLSIDDDLSMEN